jgi:hypothetical protein
VIFDTPVSFSPRVIVLPVVITLPARFVAMKTDITCLSTLIVITENGNVVEHRCPSLRCFAWWSELLAVFSAVFFSPFSLPFFARPPLFFVLYGSVPGPPQPASITTSIPTGVHRPTPHLFANLCNEIDRERKYEIKKA